MTLEKIYKPYLEQVKLMQLATVEEYQPWLCNVWYVMDEDMSVYWISRETRRHSLEIEKNPAVACTFHQNFTEGFLVDKGQALTVSGKAKKLMGEECQLPYELYAQRFPEILNFQTLEAFLQDEGHHYFYKLVPEKMIWFDEINFPQSPEQVVL